MGSKNKRKGGSARPDSNASPRQEVDRLIAKGWFKDAIKQAKICQRDHPSPEHHRLLERAYLLRAQELRDGGLTTAAREVAQNLLDFGCTDPDLTESVAALLLAVGLAGEALKLQSRLDSPEAIDRLVKQAADQAVLHPERAGATSTEMRDGANRVRMALEAVVAGDEARGLDHLRDVARASPFADWRLFARGLAASRQGNDAEARTRWERLDPSRAAARIAQTLMAVADGDTPARGTPAAVKRANLERWAFGEPLLGPLHDLRDLAAQGLWSDAVLRVGPIRLALLRFDPALAVRITQAMISPLTREAMNLGYREGKQLLQQFTKAAVPLPIDPHWFRLWALVWEGPQGDIDEAEPFWRKYLDTLDAVPTIRPEHRNQARALVLTHLGAEYASYIDADDPVEDVIPTISPEAERDRRRAIACLEESLKLFPTHRATYQVLMDLFQDTGQPDRVMEVARRLLVALPADFAALEALAQYHFRRDEPASSLEFALRARQVKPLDRSAIENEWGARVALVRHHALQGEWATARGELEAAARLFPDRAPSPHFIARRVALELKAGRAEVANQLIADAMGRLTESAALALALAIEARRFQLPPQEVDRADARWAGELAKRVRGETAGALAELLHPFLAGKITYPGRDEHIEQVVAYLGRTTRIKYGRDDLIQVCGFLGVRQDRTDLCQKLAKRGLKLFPDAPEFPMILGSFEMRKAPYQANYRVARSHFDAALKLATAREATDPRAAAIIPQVKKFLSVLDDLTGGPMGFPFGRAFSGPGGERFSSPRGMLDALGELIGGGTDPEDELDPLADDDAAPMPTPAPRPKPKGKKR